MTTQELTTPQRNCLLSIFAAHPAPYEIRGAGTLPKRLCALGLAKEIEARPLTRRFSLTEAGVERATRLAARRLADAVQAGAARHAESLASALGAGGPAAVVVPPGKPPQWPFPVSAHAWSPEAAMTGSRLRG
ncbi:hypothetical protein [Ramlibacter sp. AN1133]|uniref:hypothetical protein n=1 Tax=Ramlibacter sp. AN1133 TaxID=3133429 RepID=UPI0030C0BE00